MDYLTLSLEALLFKHVTDLSCFAKGKTQRHYEKDSVGNMVQTLQYMVNRINLPFGKYDVVGILKNSNFTSYEMPKNVFRPRREKRKLKTREARRSSCALLLK
jgi:hypothetical protein